MVCTLCLVNDFAFSIWLTVCFIALRLEHWKLIWRREQWGILTKEIPRRWTSFRTDLSSNRAAPVWGKDRHRHCKARSAKNQPLLQVQVRGRRRRVCSHSGCTSLLAHRMWSSFTLSAWVHLQASAKCLPALISNLIACIDFSYCQKCGQFTCICLYIYFQES